MNPRFSRVTATNIIRAQRELDAIAVLTRIVSIMLDTREISRDVRDREEAHVQDMSDRSCSDSGHNDL